MSKNCSIIVNGETHTLGEFKKMIEVQGLSAFMPAAFDNEAQRKAAEQLIARYAVESTPDSVIEMWAKLHYMKNNPGKTPPEYPDEDWINEQVYPAGHMNDYFTQAEIKQNTDAGSALTGIAANTGKELGYQFAAEPITSVIDNNGKVYDTSSEQNKAELVALMKVNRVGSLEALVHRNPNFFVHKRKGVDLKSEYYIRFNGSTFRELVKDALDTKTMKPLIFNGLTLNVFETIDTIINLATDNVKEQKLFVLGITNSNANLFLAGVALGIPLNEVSKLFNTPILKELSINNSRIDKRLLESKFNDKFAPGLKAAADNVASRQNLANSLGINPVSFERAFQQQTTSDIARAMGEAIYQTYKVTPELLDKVFTGQANETEIEMVNLTSLITSIKLQKIGEDMFRNARIFSLLRAMPNAKYKMDSLLEIIETSNEFGDEEAAKDMLKDEFKRVVKQGIKAKNPKMTAEQIEDEYRDIKNNSNLIQATVDSLTMASFNNRVVRNTVSRNFTPKDSAFQHNTPLLLPHVFEAFRVLKTLAGVIEDIFPIHSREVKRFMRNIIHESSLYFAFEGQEHRKAELIQKEFVKFLSSNLDLQFGETTFSLSVDPETEYDNKKGEEAWLEKFLYEFSALAASKTDNGFLAALEIPIDDNGHRRLVFSVDKQTQEELTAYFREEFRKLMEDTTVIPKIGKSPADLTKDLFKYAVLSQGMFFSRSTVATIFPESWASEFARRLDDRLKSIVDKDAPAKTALNLEELKDRFVYQFVRNNSEMISFVRGVAVKRNGTYKPGKNKIPIYEGFHEGIHYDMAYPYGNQSSYPKYITRFSNDVYMKFYTDSQFVLYKKITSNVKHDFFSYSPAEAAIPIDINKLAPHHIVANNVDVKPVREGGKTWYELKHVIPNNKDESFYKPGQIVVSRNLTNASIVETSPMYEIESVLDNGTNNSREYSRYRMKYIGEYSYTKSFESQRAAFEVISSSSTMVAHNSVSAKEAIKNGSKFRAMGAIALVEPGQQHGNSEILPITETVIDRELTPQESAALIKQVSDKLDELNKKYKTIFVSPTLLNSLVVFNITTARAIAQVMYQKTNYVHPMLVARDLKRDPKINEFNKYFIKLAENVAANLWNYQVDISSTEVDGKIKQTIDLAAGKTPVAAVVRRKVKPGDILAVGYNADGDPVFAYVEDKVDNVITISTFGKDMFMTLRENNYDIADFTQLKEAYVEKRKC